MPGSRCRVIRWPGNGHSALSGWASPSGRASEAAAFSQAAQQLYDQALGSRRVEIVPADDHGTDLLTGTRGEEVQKLITAYLAQFRAGG